MLAMPPLPPAPAPVQVKMEPRAVRPLAAESGREESEEASDLLRLDHVTGRVEIEMPWCGREPSFMTESVRRQISFLFDEPSPKRDRNKDRLVPVDPLQDSAWGVNWSGPLKAATAA